MNSSDSHLMGAPVAPSSAANSVYCRMQGKHNPDSRPGAAESSVASTAGEYLLGEGATLLLLLRLLGAPLLQLRMPCFHSNSSDWYRMAHSFRKDFL